MTSNLSRPCDLILLSFHHITDVLVINLIDPIIVQGMQRSPCRLFCAHFRLLLEL